MYLNDGQQNFTMSVVSIMKMWTQIIAVDVDYDGDNDLVSLGQFQNTFAWFQNDGLDESGVPILTRYLIERYYRRLVTLLLEIWIIMVQ